MLRGGRRPGGVLGTPRELPPLLLPREDGRSNHLIPQERPSLVPCTPTSSHQDCETVWPDGGGEAVSCVPLTTSIQDCGGHPSPLVTSSRSLKYVVPVADTGARGCMWPCREEAGMSPGAAGGWQSLAVRPWEGAREHDPEGTEEPPRTSQNPRTSLRAVTRTTGLVPSTTRASVPALVNFLGR